MNLSTQYPLWFLLLCIALGMLYAAILYYKNRHSGYGPALSKILGVFRFLVVTVIAFLLLNPLIKSTSQFTEKPIVVIGVDNSASIRAGQDSIFYQDKLQPLMNTVIGTLEGKYDLNTYTFGEKISPGLTLDFTEKLTDIASFINEVKNIYSFRNTGALIIATDGLYNRGITPLYAASGLGMPIYTIALGDTIVRRDLLIKRVNYNRISFVGNEFPLEISVEAKKSKGFSSRLSVSKNQETLYNQLIEIDRDDFLEKYLIYLEADEPGVQRYTISLSPIAEETSLENNTRDIFIDMLEGKQKVLLLANSPHPDISAIKQAVKNNINFEIEDHMIEGFTDPITGIDLVILHGLPSLKHNIRGLLEQMKSENIPTLLIVSPQTSLNLMNEVESGLIIQPENIIYNEAMPRLNQQFSTFTLTDRAISLIESAPPLVSPYGAIRMQANASPLLFQRIGAVNTSDPQWVLMETSDRKFGFILGEGIWRWRLKSHALMDDHEPFDELINKTIQFLALKVDKRFFRIITSNNYDETEDVEFEAQVYNDIYELVNDPEVKLIIRDQDGNDFPFIFNKTSNAYYLNAGRMEPGIYSYEATVNMGDRIFTERGEFTVTKLNIELNNTVADHNLLFNLAESSGGFMIYPDQLTDLKEMIDQRDDIKSIIYYQKTFSEILNNFWLLLILLVLLATEWFFRKRAGGY